ncbi:MAG: isoprenylcysteine carboxylmethyltransferase family protein [Candidatus Thorarchaeota archaeon]|nr:isoprenylcysteine carboxylmethyltransferase family protein [Candidatus Thorarchaeota archaeon]
MHPFIHGVENGNSRIRRGIKHRVNTMWFLIFLTGFVVAVPVHFLSVEHEKLERKYGNEMGERIGGILGMLSGWGFFGFWIGIWLAPQERFTIPILEQVVIAIPLNGFATVTIPVIHLTISLLFLLPGAWLGIAGVRKTGLKAAETHRTSKIVTDGVYSVVRHPQYLGGVLSHFGIVIMLSAGYAFLASPVVLLANYLISRKEEIELVKEFGQEYEDYKQSVPMFVPVLLRRPSIEARRDV